MSMKDDFTTVQGTYESFESLTLRLQQMAAYQTNPENFETKKKQFMEQFSQIFGSFTSLQQRRENNDNQMNCNNMLSPSAYINCGAATPTSTALLSVPNFKKQNSFSTTNDNNSTCATLESLPNNNSASIPNLLPLNQFNFASATQAASQPNLGLLSVPMSLISNASQSTSMYQYPYITSTPNTTTSIANTSIKSPNLFQNLGNNSVSSANTLKSVSTNAPPATHNTAYESYWMRRILSNILLLFFRYHPNGVLECELSQFYSQMFNEELVLTTDLKYLLCVHKSILITNTKERGQLYTLNDDQIPLFLQEFETEILEAWIIKHIRRLFRCFPNGIACHCLEDLLFNMVQFRLSTIMPDWHQFVCNIRTMYCCNINGVNMFIIIDLDDFNKKYAQFKGKRVEITSNNIQYYLSSHLNNTNILKRPIGYCELLIVLLSSYYTTDVDNPYFRGIDGEALEKAFHSSYQSRLVHEAPFIQHVLGKICEITVMKDNADNSNKTKYYRLLASSKQYFDTQPDAFAPILNRDLELVENENAASDDIDGAAVDSLPQSPFKEDHVSVFMGGFRQGTTVSDLRRELAKKGITMITSSGISYRNYGWSFVTLSNDKEAQYLISISPIQIAGRMIDVRPFINRQRVRNHIGNKPSNEAMLNAMMELLHKTNDNGLTVADIQSKLFRKFSYRIDGPEITKLVGDNPKYLHIKRHQTERIFWTPKLPSHTTMDELMIKINKLWKYIDVNYIGNIYQEHEDKSSASNDDNADDTKDTKITEHTISETDFENEFARRYRHAIQATNFGFNSVKELLASMHVPFKVITYHYPPMMYSNKSAPKPYTTICANGEYIAKNNHKLNIKINSVRSHKSNLTSPRFINSPSNYSNHSNHSFKSNPNYPNSPFTPYNSNATRTIISPPASQSNINVITHPAVAAAADTGPYIVNGANYTVIPSIPNSILTSNSINSNKI